MSLWRIEVLPAPGMTDPIGAGLLADAHDLGVTALEAVRASRLFLIDGALDRAGIERAAAELLADPVSETFAITGEGETVPSPAAGQAVEVHLKPGVMDPVAASTLEALGELGLEVHDVRTARRSVLVGKVTPEQVELLATRILANPTIEQVTIGTRPLAAAPEPPAADNTLRRIPLTALDDDGLHRLSREGHLFLSTEEMQAIQAHYRAAGREPTDVELETLAQTWSEHCVHKTLKARVHYRGAPMPSAQAAVGNDRGHAAGSRLRTADCGMRIGDGGPDAAQESAIRNVRVPVPHRDPQRPCPGAPPGSAIPSPPVELTFDNLLADTIARATRELTAAGRGPECLSVFVDNAGVIGFDDRYGIAFKVETHNHPSAIEPYGGAATGVGGVVRDIIGCGLAAKPIANTDVFCFAPPDWPVAELPKGVLHPRRIIKGVVAGVRDYGNRMGIPTVNGAILFDPRYLGNPLVYCGCVGLIPRDGIHKAARPGDAIVVVGGRTGRDGIHGATFSSAELTDTHAEEFSHAVQIGNAITEKKFLDCILQARDHATGCLYTAVTDCGAGGLSSAVGEMGEQIGAEVELERVPLKYAGLRYDEIWISEAQERMVLSVPPDRLDALLAIFAAEDVEATVIGRFRDDRRLILRYAGTVVGELDMGFLHDGIPRTQRAATWSPPAATDCGSRWGTGTRTLRIPVGHRDTDVADCGLKSGRSDRSDSSDAAEGAGKDLGEELLARLGALNTASKEWVIRQYDHEVQGGSAVKPLVGPGDGPSDAAVLRPRLDSARGIAIGCGLATSADYLDPYDLAVAAIDEAVRNVVAVGGDPARTAILDNFCWPKCDDPEVMGALVRTCQGCYDAAMAFGTPFVSGKDSLNNEFSLDPADVQRIERYLTARFGPPLADGWTRDGRLAIPQTLLISAIALVDDVSACVTADLKRPGQPLVLIDGSGSLARAAAAQRLVADLIRRRRVAACHDCSDGGLAVAAAEMAFAGRLGATLDASALPGGPAALFAQTTGRYLLEIADPDPVAADGCEAIPIGRVADADAVVITDGKADLARVSLDRLAEAWRQPLAW